jgi:hypothetical protein
MFKGFYFGLALSIVLATGCFAQPPGDDPPDPRVPISGIEWLLVGGGILGARKIYNNLKKR